MKWTKTYNSNRHEGQKYKTKIRKFFSIIPVSVIYSNMDIETRWLEWVYVEYEYSNSSMMWFANRFLTEEEYGQMKRAKARK